MEGLKEPWALRVEATKVQVAKLSSKLISQDETGVNDLTLLAISQRCSVFRPSDRVLDGTKDLSQDPQVVVGQCLRLSETNDGVVGQGGPQGRTDRVNTSTLSRYTQHRQGTEISWKRRCLKLRRHGSRAFSVSGTRKGRRDGYLHAASYPALGDGSREGLTHQLHGDRGTAEMRLHGRNG